jgi:hypothetical protein
LALLLLHHEFAATGKAAATLFYDLNFNAAPQALPCLTFLMPAHRSASYLPSLLLFLDDHHGLPTAADNTLSVA